MENKNLNGKKCDGCKKQIDKSDCHNIWYTITRSNYLSIEEKNIKKAKVQLCQDCGREMWFKICEDYLFKTGEN